MLNKINEFFKEAPILVLFILLIIITMVISLNFIPVFDNDSKGKVINDYYIKKI